MDYVFAPNEVFQDGRLSKIQLRILLCLWSFRDHKTSKPIYPKRKTISERVGYDERVVSRTTAELEALGWITKKMNNGLITPYRDS